MTWEKENEIYRKALDHFGSEHQIKKCIEELTELSLALQRYIKEPSPVVLDSIIDEIADVFVTTNQMSMLFGEGKVGNRMVFKLERISDIMLGNIPYIPTDEQLEHTVMVDGPSDEDYVKQLGGAVVGNEEFKKVRMPHFDGIGDEYDKALLIKDGRVVDIFPSPVKNCISDLITGNLLDKSEFYPVVPTWRILKAAEEDKTLVVTRWNRASKSFQDNDSPDFCLQDIYGLRQVEAVDYSCEAKIKRLMKIVNLSQDDAEALVKQIGWARAERILSLSDRSK